MRHSPHFTGDKTESRNLLSVTLLTSGKARIHMQQPSSGNRAPFSCALYQRSPSVALLRFTVMGARPNSGYQESKPCLAGDLMSLQEK